MLGMLLSRSRTPTHLNMPPMIAMSHIETQVGMSAIEVEMQVVAEVAWEWGLTLVLNLRRQRQRRGRREGRGSKPGEISPQLRTHPLKSRRRKRAQPRRSSYVGVPDIIITHSKQSNRLSRRDNNSRRSMRNTRDRKNSNLRCQWRTLSYVIR